MAVSEQKPAGRLFRLLPALVLILVVSDGAASAVSAEERIALVVGNQDYASVAPLDNPVSDARLIATKLENKGFDVRFVTDVGQAELNRAIAQFGRDLRSAGKDTAGLFYYAGHAVQSFGANYLLPVDVALTDAADLSLVAVRADAVLRQMSSAENRTNIVILDSCRNNPFVDVPDMNDNGLAEMKAPTGTFMAYSTAPGSVALDGTNGNSPFTAALAAEMDVEGLAIEQAFKQVRGRVLAATAGHQTPWDTTSLTQDFFFTPAVQKSPEDLAAERFFESIKQTRDPVQIVLFLRTYPDSEYFGEARALLSEVLDRDSAPAAETAPAATPGPAVTAPPKAPAGPEEREKALIEAAQVSGNVADYEAYLAEFPDGVFKELAQTEIAAKVAKDPEAPPGGLKESAAVAAASAPAGAGRQNPPVSDVPPQDVVFDMPLSVGGPEFVGQSIETLIAGAPLFPPIEGLPDAVWKDRACSTCHEWTREALCDQAKTYLAEGGTRSLGKEHPYGGDFKKSLRDWASGGCR